MRGFLLLLILLVPITSNANDLSESIVKRLDSSETLRGEFTQSKQLALLPQPIKSSGQFLYNRSYGLLWHTEQPLQNRIIFTQEGIRNLDQSEEAPSNQGKDSATKLFSRLFFALISADLAHLQRYFEINGKNHSKTWQLQLTPKQSDIAKVIQTLELQGDKQLQQVMFVDSNGDRTEIHFFNQENHPLSKKEQAQLVH